MLVIHQLKCSLGHSEEELIQKIQKQLHLKKHTNFSYQILKQSIDARRKDQICYVYSIGVTLPDEDRLLKKFASNKNIGKDERKPYQFPPTGEQQLSHRPVIIGSGPAGLFCAWMLASHGYRPIIFERGSRIEERKKEVEHFWATGNLIENSNVQFGEGGAGTFSDGKLNTLVKDREGRNRKVLEMFVHAGAKEEILYLNKPHLGTDALERIVKNLREQIEEMGGEFHFRSRLIDFSVKDGRLFSLQVETDSGQRIEYPAEVMVLAIGHSARDTFQMLTQKPLSLQPKPFAVGVRIEHLQEKMNQFQYGSSYPSELPAAEYKCSAKTKRGRGVYTFCMCPGGYVVNASSEQGMLAINGMSYSGRSGKNSNSAVIVTVTPEDFPQKGVLSGMYLQRELERRAFSLTGGKIPVQRFCDFQKKEVHPAGEVTPSMKGSYEFADVSDIFPSFLSQSIIEGIFAFDQKIHGFASGDSLLSGVESRTSSPIKILRNDQLESEIKGIYPCGEGAGYAGGITSAAMDGIKCAEAIAKKYAPTDYGAYGES